MAGTYKWKQLSKEEAEKHPLYGVRGWLLVISLLLIVYLVAAPLIQISAKEWAGVRNPRCLVPAFDGLDRV